ncbi:MAG TPA: DMT family transporter [Patescibacteria group bacterium]|nr:DMT family transporter [Patescibacteria group bacterium]
MKTTLLTLLVIIFWGLWGFFGKLSATRIAGQGSLWNSISLVVITIVFIFATRQAPPLKFDGGGILFGVLAGIFSAIASVLFYFLLQKKSAGVFGATIAVYPLVTLLLSVVFLKEHVSFVQTIGVVFALVGLVLLNL